MTNPCSDCGVCCMHMSVPPYDESLELDWLEEYRPEVYADYQTVVRRRELQVRVHGTDFVPCGFFDPFTGQCRHYHDRPNVCETFAVGNDHCQEMRRDAGLVPLTLPVPVDGE